jgi:hypothetical protein
MKKLLPLLLLAILPGASAAFAQAIPPSQGVVQGSFGPSAFGATKTITCGTSSTSVTGLTTTDPTMMVYNAGTVVVYLRWGVGAQTAVINTDQFVPPGTVRVFPKNNLANADTVACISGTAAQTVYVVSGYGRQ